MLLAPLLLVGVHLMLLRRSRYVRHREWLVSGELVMRLQVVVSLMHCGGGEASWQLQDRQGAHCLPPHSQHAVPPAQVRDCCAP